MGYEIYITRRENWYDDGPPEITLAEWQAAAGLFSELVVVRSSVVEDARQMCDDLGCTPFWYSDGQIAASKPFRRALMTMCALAKILDARVMGDSEEVYDEHGVPNKDVSYHFIPRDV